MGKQIWQKTRSGNETWRDVNINQNRRVLKYIRDNFTNSVITPSDIQNNLGISRQASINVLSRLFKSGYLRSKKLTKKKTKDSRVFILSKKGRNQLPQKKNQTPKTQIIEKEVKESYTQEVVDIV